MLASVLSVFDSVTEEGYLCSLLRKGLCTYIGQIDFATCVYSRSLVVFEKCSRLY